jgi:CRISP-associated protein Cas1
VPILYLTEDRTLVRRDSEDCLLVQLPEKREANGSVIPACKQRVVVAKIEGVVVMGEITLTASALHLLLNNNIEVNFLNYAGKFKGRLSPPLSKNSLLRLAQHQAHHNLVRRSELARRFVLGKLTNQRMLLLRYNRRLNDEKLAEAAANMNGIIRRLAGLDIATTTTTTTSPTTAATAADFESAVTLATGDTGIANSWLEVILGLEGAGSAAYFGCLDKLLVDNEQGQWRFPGRVKRPPSDPVNALLSFDYSLLTNQVASELQTVGFDQYVGFLHSSVYGRPALALDLMEEFRPIIVDSVVITMLNNRMLKATDFTHELNSYRLRPDARKLFLQKFEERLNEEIQHPIFGYRVNYRRCIELQARLVAKFLAREIEEYLPFTVR